jgi:hypothetical protein
MDIEDIPMKKLGIILGCGPAAMFAAHAMTLKGWNFRIFTKVKRKSEMFGAQYLHEPIPGLSQSDGTALSYALRGTAAAYREKVYGTTPVPAVSPESLVGKHGAWDIREAYDMAWDLYSGRIEAIGPIGPAELDALNFSQKPRRIFATIPATSLCYRSHGFRQRPVWAIGDAPERGIWAPVVVPDMTVVCNGEPEPHWYRASRVFGHTTVEWPDGPKPPLSEVAQIHKPIDTDCDCFTHLRGFHRLGRFGRWQKSILAHHAFAMATAVL